MHKSWMNILWGILALTSISAFAEQPRYKPGEVIVKYRDGTELRRSDRINLYRALGVQHVSRYSELMKGFERLLLDGNVRVEEAIAELERNPAVEYAEPNYIISIDPLNLTEDEPEFELPRLPCIIPPIPGIFPGFPEGCDNGSTTERPSLQPAPAEVDPPVADPRLNDLYGLQRTQTAQAWESHKGTKSFIVADIDTGIDYNHEDLAFNLWRNPTPSEKNDVVGYDFVHDDGLPYDDNIMVDPTSGARRDVHHGTHTAGTIGAVGGNGKGIVGVNQRVSIMSLKFLSAEGSGDMNSAVRAIDYAVSHGAKVLNNSWGGPLGGARALSDAIARSRVRGVLFIAAAGNGNRQGIGQDNDDPAKASYPASFPHDNIIAVAATDQDDALTRFSNFGKRTVHLAAPGKKVLSTQGGNRYQELSGTSMACPHVAGAAALLWSKNPSWDYKKVKEVLLGSVDALPALAEKTVSSGRLNIFKALRLQD